MTITLPRPVPLADIAQARADIAEHGLAIVTDALPADTVHAAREALERAAAFDRHTRADAEADRSDHGTQRVWNLPSRDPVFCELVEHPAALDLARGLLGQELLLSDFSGNITEPGSGEMFLHTDQSMSPLPWAAPHGINMIWCLDDFTEETGATRIVPGSHRLSRKPIGDERDSATVAVEAPAGSLIAMEGRVWHKTGANRSPGRQRAGVFAYYTLPVILPRENWWLSLDPAVRQFGSDTLLELLGFKGDRPLGRVNGRAVG